MSALSSARAPVDVRQPNEDERNALVDYMAVNDRILTSVDYFLAGVDYAKSVVAELIEVAAEVHAACRVNKEPDLIALADALDAVGAKATRKAALARVQGGME